MKAIENEEQHEAALENAYALFQQDIVPDSKELDELEMLSWLINEYEQQHYPIQ